MPVLRPLHSGWTLRAAGPAPLGDGPVPATVPGCVHTDLLDAGLIPDPYLDANELELAWIGRTPWVYETTFDAALTGDRVELVADGLDTVATVTLNGIELGRTANMHRSYRFDVREALRPTGNHLEVRFDSAYDYALAVRDAVGERPNAYDEPFQYIRKMASNFGWDWGPTLVTAGIWQSIGLHSWSVARLAEVRPLVTVDGTDGIVDVHVTVERAGDEPLTVTATVAGVTATATIAAGETSAVVTVTVPDVRLWWPRGFGSPDRYELDVTLRADASVVDAWQRRVGFRTVEIDTTADADGTAFILVVNGVPVFVRGSTGSPTTRS
ncbi:glycoside hydrolase family 2 protein [Dactylosporangium cerinum]